jgi:hypothetical protein
MYHIPAIGKVFTFTDEIGKAVEQTVVAVEGTIVTLRGLYDPNSNRDLDAVMNGRVEMSYLVNRQVRLNMSGAVEDVA